MSLHLGNDFIISSRQVVGILRVDSGASGIPELKTAHKTGSQDRIRLIGPGPYRSAVVCTKRIYFSPMEASTLTKRIQAGIKFLRVAEAAYGQNE